MTTTLPCPELIPIREKYTHEVEKIENGKGHWATTKVTILRNGEAIYTYDRNYSMMRTFEPFRQLQGESWREYALISSRYTTFQVLDLETLEIVAERPYPLRPLTQRGYDWYMEKKPEVFVDPESGYYKASVGDMVPEAGAGFCPVDFHVPDLVTDYTFTTEEQWNDFFSEENRNNEDHEFTKSYSGQFGFYSGCIWGDDSGGWKLRYIDLSKISEGVVVDDERFGYWELPAGPLSQSIEYDSDYMKISGSFMVDITSGEVPTYYRDMIKWK